MRKTKGRRGIMTVKIDFEKAYDRIRWPFIRRVLEEAGLDGKFTNLVMDCITSSSLNVLWNGERTEDFLPSQGIRQGDPMSPFIFVLCMEKLSHIIQDRVRDSTWKPVLMTKEGPSISHLMFADDLLLFGEASESQALCMTEAIEMFCVASGAKVNCSKSSVFFSLKVAACVKGRVKSLLGMKISEDFGKYLGFPLSKQRRNKNTFQYVIDRVKSKLAMWKVNCLSTAGRITMAKYVISSIPLYPMQVAQLPISVCQEVERLQRNFIWGRNDESRGYHPVGWETVTQPKKYGGLGIKRLSVMNCAFGAKLAWALIRGSNSLWVEVMQKKYMYREGSSLLQARSTDSRLWKFICKQQSVVEAGSCWQIRNGRSISFFQDCWLFKDKRLKDYCIRQLDSEEIQSSVAEWVRYGTWDLSRLVTVVKGEIIQMLLAILPPMSEAGNDILMWNATAHGNFSVKSAYFLIEKPPAQLHSNVFKKIWAWKGVERVRVFLWLAFHNRLPTNERRRRWSSGSATCAYCEVGIEDEMHIFRDCYYARQVWLSLIHPRYVTVFFMLPLKDWFALNLAEELGLDRVNPWCLIWGVGIWFLWKWRNNCVFQDHLWKPYNPSEVIKKSWHLYCMAIPSYQDLSIPSLNNPCRWSPPPPGWFKLNVDGAVSLSEMKAGCGGVIRDHMGLWISGFTQTLGFCNAYMAEEWALLLGLRRAWDEGLKHILVESDAKLLVEKLLRNCEEPNTTLVFLQIKQMLLFSWDVKIMYVPRVCNLLADGLAKEGRYVTSLIHCCPPRFRNLFCSECMGPVPFSYDFNI
ncbi:hypothetical protein QN277_024391 [Acacia crassicarpa]|uniref:Reverse transcriptase domain-containing protein n=1 Tax=Acacia crassicarpa TaxID=499986 RepID=A0AAE1MN15_9FABA|nr:hypothetical protein QN277_024391 [Acacia crassicarpa]